MGPPPRAVSEPAQFITAQSGPGLRAINIELVRQKREKRRKFKRNYDKSQSLPLLSKLQLSTSTLSVD